MTKPHKIFSEALLSESLSAAHEVAQVSAEAGPLKKMGGNYQFDTLIHRPRGHPKLFRVTVEEIH